MHHRFAWSSHIVPESCYARYVLRPWPRRSYQRVRRFRTNRMLLADALQAPAVSLLSPLASLRVEAEGEFAQVILRRDHAGQAKASTGPSYFGAKIRTAERRGSAKTSPLTSPTASG